MRASVIREFGRPWSLEVLPDPEPGPGQVVVQVRASGVCGTDVHVHHGFLDVETPLVAGHEAVGVVVAAGPGVRHPAVGARVGVSWLQRGCGSCRWCASGHLAHCERVQTWMDLGGGHAELMLAWADGCTLVPDEVDDAHAAPLFCAGHTVMAGLRAAAPQPGDRVAVLGLGGLGHLAVQCASTLGWETLALTSTDEKAADARGFGAHDAVTVDAHSGRALEDAGGADVVLCTSNSATQVAQVLSGLRPTGRLVNMGVLDGPLVLDPIDLTSRALRVIGAVPDRRRDLVDVLELAAAGRVAATVESYPLDAHNEVLERVQQGRVRYRAVLIND